MLEIIQKNKLKVGQLVYEQRWYFQQYYKHCCFFELQASWKILFLLAFSKIKGYA